MGKKISIKTYLRDTNLITNGRHAVGDEPAASAGNDLAFTRGFNSLYKVATVRYIARKTNGKLVKLTANLN
jgi:hypothetical protein